MNNSVIVRCPQCGTGNRIPTDRMSERGICGKCRARLPAVQSYHSRPVDVSDGNFISEVKNFPGPVLVEFTAPW